MRLFSYTILITVFFTLSGMSSFAQGFLMLAGGGGESAGGWSDAPYRWVVEHSHNKRIAVISYDAAATDWIPNYFKSFGAKAAKNILIASRTTADLQSLYDTLITYDGVFIKGGDQAKYYNYYKGTKTQAALQYIYNNGGVLSGTSAGTAILSPIVYTAEIASVDPAYALQNAYSPQITLANDFLNTIEKKYIFDTHFAERGRFGRLSSFLASWYKKTKEVVIGIGVDDHTALCIDSLGKATVYGTGAAGFYHNMDAAEPYDTTVTMLRANSMKYSQLTHGNTFDLNTGSIKGMNALIQPLATEENARLTLLFSGTDYPSDDAYTYFVDQTGSKEDAIVIVTGTDLTRANDAKSKLLAKGATDVSIIQAVTSNQNDITTRDAITKAKKFFIIANDYSLFTAFIKGNGNGSLLDERFKQPGMISFFAGDNARFAGKTVIDKYTGSGYTSYRGTLEFKPGLGLLRTTAIMPNAFNSTDTYENTVTGLPYAMMTDSLTYGLYITATALAGYGYTADNKSYFKNISGNSPLIFLQNNGTSAGFANQGPYPVSRNIAGFESVNLKFLGLTDTVTTGTNVVLSIKNPSELNMNIYPNPAKDSFHIQGQGSHYSVQVADMTGRIVLAKQFLNNTDINLEACCEGLYLVNIYDLNSNHRFSTKLCVKK
jgi:cyanophycinase